MTCAYPSCGRLGLGRNRRARSVRCPRMPMPRSESRRRKLDIVDSIFAARHRLRQIEVLTFDKDLLKQMEKDGEAEGET